jgi:hypothetical protein
VPVPRCCFAARSGRLPRAGLLLATAVVLLLPAFALAFVSTGTDGCLCQSPQPPGDPFTVIVLLDACHSWLAGGPVGVTPVCGSEAVTGGGLAPQSFACTAASVGRPPPLRV